MVKIEHILVIRIHTDKKDTVIIATKPGDSWTPNLWTYICMFYSYL